MKTIEELYRIKEEINETLDKVFEVIRELRKRAEIRHDDKEIKRLRDLSVIPVVASYIETKGYTLEQLRTSIENAIEKYKEELKHRQELLKQLTEELKQHLDKEDKRLLEYRTRYKRAIRAIKNIQQRLPGKNKEERTQIKKEVQLARVEWIKAKAALYVYNCKLHRLGRIHERQKFYR